MVYSYWLSQDLGCAGPFASLISDNGIGFSIGGLDALQFALNS